MLPSTQEISPEYRRRDPESTVLYRVLQEHLETFLARIDSDPGQPSWPEFVKRELWAYLSCGVLCRGFCRLHCDQCGKDEIVAFSCKGRGFCQSCGGRRMAETAAHLVDNVLPPVPMRQWVLTVPYRVRYLIAFDRALCMEVRRIFMRAVMAWQRKEGRRQGIVGGESGAVVFLQRFGSAINLNPHFHALVLDGLYSRPSLFESVEFHPLPEPTDQDVAEVVWRIRTRVLTLLQQKGLIPEEAILEEDPIPFESPQLGACYAASVQGRDRVARVGRNQDAPYVAFTGERCAEAEGFTLHANVHIHGRDRFTLERLIRYMARPAVASRRLSLLPDGRVSYRLRRAWNDGTHTLVFEPLEFIEKLAALVPPPRAHLVSYHGVFGPNAAWRSAIVPQKLPNNRQTGYPLHSSCLLR